MIDLSPALLTELLAALIGLVAACAVLIRGVPGAFKAVGGFVDRFLKTRETEVQTEATAMEAHASSLKAATDRAISAEFTADGLRRQVADRDRLLAAARDENAMLREQIAGHRTHRS